MNLEKIYDDEVPEKITSFWFTLLGYVSAIVAMKLAEFKIPSHFISTALIISYLFLFIWVQVKVKRAYWWIWPDLKPTNDVVSSKKRFDDLKRGGFTTGLICCVIYYFSSHVVNLIVGASNA